MRLIKKSGRILRIGRARDKAGERTKNRRGPLPSIAHEIIDAPRRPSRGVAADRLWLPTLEVEHAARGVRRFGAPRERPRTVGRHAVGGPLILSLRRET